MQTWKINGQVYNWEQLQEMKRKQIAPTEAKVVIHPKDEEEEEVKKVPLEEMNFFALKALAKEHGMPVEADTKKPAILEYLKFNQITND